MTVGLVLPRIWLSEAGAQIPLAASGKKLVVIQLAGGNDGLNTVVPYTDSHYYALRPMLAVRDNELKTAGGSSTIISNDFGLHPSMGELKGLYDQGKVGIVLGAGYPDPNLSHFLSMDIWHTADLSGLGRTGWLGRYADLAFIGQPGLPVASFGSLQLPKTLNAEHFVTPNIINFDLYNFLTDPNYPGDSGNQLNAFNAAASRNFPADSFASAINTSSFQSVQGAQLVQSAISKYTSSVQYPENNPLAIALRMVAQLLATVPEASVMYVQMGGFDHHSDQVDKNGSQPVKTQGQHAVLLHWFSEAVKLFHDDLTEHGLADSVLMLQWSEFGRRPEENASLGTDHGTAAPLFVIGNGVNGGLHGEQPSLDEDDFDDAGNVRFTVDFRQVYAEILDRWFAVDSRQILGANYSPVGVLDQALASRPALTTTAAARLSNLPAEAPSSTLAMARRIFAGQDWSLLVDQTRSQTTARALDRGRRYNDNALFERTGSSRHRAGSE